MATKTTLVYLLLGSSGTGSGTLQNRYCGGFLNPSNGLTVNAPVRDCTQPVSFPGFMMNSVSQQHFAKKNPSIYGNSINPVWGFVCDGCNNWWKRCDWHKWQRRSVSNLDPRALCHKQGRIKHSDTILVTWCPWPRPAAYPVPFIAIARDGSNFPGEKMSALLLSIPQWDSFY